MRVTRKQVEIWFKLVCKEYVKPAECLIKDASGKWICQEGAWELDYNPSYGGYIINEMCNGTGGVRQPVLAHRVSGREFVDMCRTLLAARRLVGLK